MVPATLAQVLGRRDALALAFGAMIGWSWVLLTGPWTTQAGSIGALLGFALGGLAMIFVALCYAELASAMPEAGGEHVYSLRALGRTPSFICSWAIVLGYVSVAAFETVAFPYALSHLMPGLDLGYLWTLGGFDIHLSFVATGLLGAVLVSFINVRGLLLASRVQNVVTAFIVLCGLVVLVGALLRGDTTNLQPHFEGGIAGLAAVLIVVPMMFMGFDVIPQAAAEIRLPHAALGRVIVVSVLCGMAFYCAMILAVGLALPAETRAAAGMTTALASESVWGGRWAGTLLILGGVAGIVTTWNAFVVGASRLLYSMAEDGMLPAVFAQLHPRYRTPHVAILTVGMLTCLAPWFGRPVLLWLINAGSFGVVIGYALVALSFLCLRWREPAMPRPYRVSGGIAVGWTALTVCLGLIMLFMPGSLAALSREEWLICLAWAGFGWACHAATRPKLTRN